MANFRKVSFEMKRCNGYGQYLIEATYKGKILTVHTTNSEAWDYINDISNKEKHNEALRYCYYQIVNAYENM